MSAIEPEESRPVEDPAPCGIGQGALCCAYLTMTPRVGFTCEQRSPLRGRIQQAVASGSMGSQQLPEAAFPACQQERAAALS